MKKFQRAVLSLPEKQRLVFNMRYYDDMKYGLDKKWWKDKQFISYVKDVDSHKTYQNAVNSFEKYAGTDKDKVYILILYKADGEWHIARADRLGTLQTSYEKGKGSIVQ